MTGALRHRALNALGWAYASTAARIAIQFGCGIALARILGPEPFGMVAAAWVMVGVASQFVDCGFGSALVQQKEISSRDIRFAFTLQLAAGITLSAALAATAGTLARWVANPGIGGLIALLSLSLLIQALGQTASSLLRRALDFRTLQLAQLAGTIAGYGFVALPMAQYGWGPKSLVAAQLTQSLVTTVAIYAKVRHPLIPLVDRKRRSLVSFGLKATATNLGNWAITGIDSLAMTRYFGAAATGFYNRAQVLALVPAAQVVQVLQSVLFPAYSRRTQDAAVLRRVYLASLTTLGLVLLPAGAALAVAARTTITALYGPAWETAADFLAPLALAMPLNCAMALNGPLLWARDRVADELFVQYGVLALFAGALYAAGRLSAQAIAWAVVLVYSVRFAAMTHRTLMATGISWRECLSALGGPLLLAALAAGAAACTDALMAAYAAPLRLAAIILVTAASTLGVLVAFSPSLLPEETGALVRSFRDRLAWPRILRPRLPHSASEAASGEAR